MQEADCFRAANKQQSSIYQFNLERDDKSGLKNSFSTFELLGQADFQIRKQRTQVSVIEGKDGEDKVIHDV